MRLARGGGREESARSSLRAGLPINVAGASEGQRQQACCEGPRRGESEQG